MVTFNSDIPGGARLCYVGEDAHRAGRIAGEIAAKFLRPGEPLLLVYAGPAYAGHKARADGFLERLGELGFRREDCRIAATHNDYGETLEAVTAALEAEPDLRYVYMANLSVPACVEAIRRDYALSDGDARLLFEHVWIYTFGLGTLCAGGTRFSQERLQGMLSTSFRALLTLAKTGQLRETGTKP